MGFNSGFKGLNITYSDCVSVALLIQHAKHMRRIISSPLACLTVPYFCTLSPQTVRFRKKGLFNIKTCILIFPSHFSETFLILTRIQRDMIKNVYWSSCKVAIILCTWIRASRYNYENNQQDALYRLLYYSKPAVHVLGDVFTHHQEYLTVFTVSGSVHSSCCRLPDGRNLGEHYQIL